MIRGIRGATTVPANDRDSIFEAVGALLDEIVRLNGVEPSEVAAVYFTSTADLDAAHPATAVRLRSGWGNVPLMCAAEPAIKGALTGCVRMLVLWETGRSPLEVRHAYLRGATALRPDLPPVES